jgi:hypothetical protein
MQVMQFVEISNSRRTSDFMISDFMISDFRVSDFMIGFQGDLSDILCCRLCPFIMSLLVAASGLDGSFAMHSLSRLEREPENLQAASNQAQLELQENAFCNFRTFLESSQCVTDANSTVPTPVLCS